MAMSGIRRRGGFCLREKVSGYIYIGLLDDYNEKKTLRLHRIIAITFIPNPEQKPTVNHKNHKRDDNRLENLEWATSKEQAIHQVKSSGPRPTAIWKCHKETNEKIQKYDSIKMAAKDVTNDKYGHIYISKAHRNNKPLYGFRWELVSIIIPGEIWKSLDSKHVDDVEGYHISSEGRIKNHLGKVGSPTGKIGEYLRVTVSGRRFMAHRLVALTFLHPMAGKNIVNHIDGVKSNCRVTNLEWVTSSENSQHAVDTGLSKAKKTIKQYNLKGDFIAEFPSLKDACTGLRVKYISPFRKVSCGFQWRWKCGDVREVTDVSQDVSTGKNYTVKQYDMSGNFIREFESVKKARFSVDGEIKMKAPFSHGFQWRRSQFDDSPVLDLSHKTKRQRRS